jgi:hypothetical protein
VAVSFSTCLQIIAAILERPAIEQILTHLGCIHNRGPKGGRRAGRGLSRGLRGSGPHMRASSGRHTTPRPDNSGLGTLAVLGIAFVRRSSHQNSPWAGAAHGLQERTETGRCMAAQGCPETPTRRIYPHAPSCCRQASDAHGSLGRVRHHCRKTRKALAH